MLQLLCLLLRLSIWQLLWSHTCSPLVSSMVLVCNCGCTTNLIGCGRQRMIYCTVLTKRKERENPQIPQRYTSKLHDEAATIHQIPSIAETNCTAKLLSPFRLYNNTAELLEKKFNTQTANKLIRAFKRLSAAVIRIKHNLPVKIFEVIDACWPAATSLFSLGEQEDMSEWSYRV